MRIDEDIWNDSAGRPGHILLPEEHANSTLLAMPGGKLVPDFRYSDLPCLDFDNSPVLCIIRYASSLYHSEL